MSYAFSLGPKLKTFNELRFFWDSLFKSALKSIKQRS